MNLESSYRFNIPRNSLNIVEDFVKVEYPRSFEKNLCNYLYVVSYVHSGMYKHRRKVPVNRDVLMVRLGVNPNNASRILKNLCLIGVLKKESSYVKGKKSSTYSVDDNSELTLSIPFKVFEHTAIKNIIERRNMNRLNKQKNLFEDSLERSLLSKYLLDITIDPTLINNIISFPLFSFSYLSPYPYHLEDEEEIQEFKSEFKNIVSIYNKDIFIKRNDDKGRVFTNFTVMDRDHRPYLSYKGQTLKCLDISNSQPLIFCAFLKTYCLENNIELPQEEFEVYKELVEKGVFYERFMNGSELVNEDRKEFKQAFFGSVFYTKVSKVPYELRKRFVKVFPNIYRIMDNIKKEIGNDGFALKMQELEANIIWDNVNAPMLREGYKCYNIYDSIVSHDLATIEEAKKRISGQFSLLGITPNFKLEIFE